MEKIPMSKEEIALEILKTIVTPKEESISYIVQSIKDDAKTFAEAYNTILETISNPSK